jgi:hypothetical protein
MQWKQVFKCLLTSLCLWVCHITGVILQKRNLCGRQPLQLEIHGKWEQRQITVPLRTADSRPQLWLIVIMLVRVHVYCSCCAVGNFIGMQRKVNFFAPGAEMLQFASWDFVLRLYFRHLSFSCIDVYNSRWFSCLLHSSLQVKFFSFSMQRLNVKMYFYSKNQFRNTSTFNTATLVIVNMYRWNFTKPPHNKV